MVDLIAYVCPECRGTENYFGHLFRPETKGEYCPNHVSRDPKTGVVAEKKVELVPARG